jgi:hypothetical protein
MDSTQRTDDSVGPQDVEIQSPQRRRAPVVKAIAVEKARKRGSVDPMNGDGREQSRLTIRGQDVNVVTLPGKKSGAFIDDAFHAAAAMTTGKRQGDLHA